MTYECWYCGRRHIERRVMFCEECGRPPHDSPDCACPDRPEVGHLAIRAYDPLCGGWLKRSDSLPKSRSARKRKIYRQLGLEGSKAKNGNKRAGQRVA